MSRKCVVCDERRAQTEDVLCAVCDRVYREVAPPDLDGDLAWAARRARGYERKRAKARERTVPTARVEPVPRIAEPAKWKPARKVNP